MALAFDTPIALKRPIRVEFIRDGRTEIEEITEVTMREPTGKELLLIDRYQAQPMKLTIEMVAALTGLHVKTVEKMARIDLVPLGELALGDAESGRATGDDA